MAYPDLNRPEQSNLSTARRGTIAGTGNLFARIVLVGVSRHQARLNQVIRNR